MTLTRLITALSCIALSPVIIGGCQTPFVTGVGSSIGATGTSSITLVSLTEMPRNLTLEGDYDVREGALRVRLVDPDGAVPFDQTYSAVSSGEIHGRLEPIVGEWTLMVTSPGGSGSYRVQLRY